MQSYFASDLGDDPLAIISQHLKPMHVSASLLTILIFLPKVNPKKMLIITDSCIMAHFPLEKELKRDMTLYIFSS
jgi:hypothetical protein